MTLWEKFKAHPLTPNGISIFRGVVGLILPFMILSHFPFWHITAAAVFTVGAVSDYWDGYLARKHKGVSDTGKILDPSMDKILILGALAAFASLGYFSRWWLVPIFFREIVITFFRVAWLWEGKAAGAEQLGKIKLVLQVSLASACFFLLMFSDFHLTAGLAAAARVFMWIFLPLCLFLTLVSGLSFFYSNWDHFQSPAFAQFASACGVGLIPFAPGTLGTIFGLAIIPFVAWNFWVWIFTFLFLLTAGHWAVSRLDLTQNKDPHFVVMDEVLGIFISLAGIAPAFWPYLAGFFFFRLFDVVKPYPCRKLEKLPGFWGITCDDLMAGVYARAAVFLIFHV